MMNQYRSSITHHILKIEKNSILFYSKYYSIWITKIRCQCWKKDI